MRFPTPRKTPSTCIVELETVQVLLLHTFARLDTKIANQSLVDINAGGTPQHAKT
jgi:hypothetical protein